MRGPRRIGYTGSALIRLLARLTDVDAPESKQAFAEQLSQWLGWTDAISLSAALNSTATATRPGTKAAASTEEDEFHRLRAALAHAIADEGAPTRGSHPMDTSSADFSSYRRRYFAKQQTMDTAIGALRGRLRSSLAARSADATRLAAVDALMEQVLGERERSLLSIVPVLLEKHFERLRQPVDRPSDAAEALDAADPPTDLPAPPDDAWRSVFAKDMQDILAAELEFRLQPIEGLLEALRATPAPRPPNHPIPQA